MGKVVLIAVACLVGMVVIYPHKVKSWADSTQDAAGSSISI